MSFTSPYAPPANTYASNDFEPLGWRTNLATMAIVGACVANLVGNGVIRVVGDVGDADLDANLGKAALLFVTGLGMVALALLAPIMFLVWFHRAAKNVRAFGHDGLEYSPGWCVGWWFIPIAMLWKPYRAMKEVFRASDPEAVREGSSSEWLLRPLPTMLGLWWGFWIVSKMFDRLAARIPDASTSSALGIVGAVVSIGAAVCVIMIMRTVTKNQAACWEILQQRGFAPPPPPVSYRGYGAPPAYDPGYGPPAYGPPGYAANP